MELDPMARVLFPRPPPSYGVDSFPGELIWVPRSLNPQTSSPQDCIPLCLLQCRGARYLIIYIHSNFEDIGRCHSFCLSLRHHLQVHVLVVEYPGYGISPGTSCDEQGATESAHVALRFAHEVLRWPWDSIILFGRSIGTGPATQLAAKHRFGGLVLVCPFLSVRELCREYVGAAASLIWERFPNQELIPLVRAPCLFIHGVKDQLIPARHGVGLHAACTARKRLIMPEDMEHNSNLLDAEDFLLAPMRDFFRLPGTKGVEMQVPSWAFDKQLSPQFVPPTPSLVQRRAACSLLGSGCTCPGVCRQLGCGGINTKLVLVEPVKSSGRSSAKSDVKSADVWVVEEAGGCGNEQQGCQEEELPPLSIEVPIGAAALVRDDYTRDVPPALANDPALGRRMEQLLRRTEELVHKSDLETVLRDPEEPRADSVGRPRVAKQVLFEPSLGSDRDVDGVGAFVAVDAVDSVDAEADRLREDVEDFTTPFTSTDVHV